MVSGADRAGTLGKAGVVVGDIESSERMVDDWVRLTQERAEKFQEMAERVEELSVTERSADGLVQVTVSSKGMLAGLVIAEDASGRRMSEVSALIMRTVQAAQARIPQLLAEAMEATVGTDDQAANHILAEAVRTFPEPPEPDDEPPPGEMRFEAEIVDDQEPENPPPPSHHSPPPRARRRDDDDGDDDMDDSIYS